MKNLIRSLVGVALVSAGALTAWASDSNSVAPTGSIGLLNVSAPRAASSSTAGLSPTAGLSGAASAGPGKADPNSAPQPLGYLAVSYRTGIRIWLTGDLNSLTS